MTKLKRNKLFCIAIIVFGIVVDFISKRIIATSMELEQSIPLWRDVLHITYVHNKGAAFGMLASDRWVFISISTIAIIAFCIYLVFTKSERTLWLCAFAMMASGGIGNMIDRIWLGYVVDFIDFTLIDFAVFNIADTFICVGAGLMMLDLIIDLVQSSKQEKAAAQANGGEGVAVDTAEEAPIANTDVRHDGVSEDFSISEYAESTASEAPTDEQSKEEQKPEEEKKDDSDSTAL